MDLTLRPSVSLLSHRQPLGYGAITTTITGKGNSW